MFRTMTCAALLAAATLLAGCGQRGPLYLPGQPAAPKPTPKASPVPTDAATSTTTSPTAPNSTTAPVSGTSTPK